jgi:hypothetical protein
MKAFICHYSPLIARRQYLESMLSKLGFKEIEWVTEKEISQYDISKVYDPSPTALELRNSTSFARFGMKYQKNLNKALTFQGSKYGDYRSNLKHPSVK